MSKLFTHIVCLLLITSASWCSTNISKTGMLLPGFKQIPQTRSLPNVSSDLHKFPIIPDPQLPEPADGSDNSTIEPELQSLRDLISSSIWMVHVSNNLEEAEASEAVQNVYIMSLDENKRVSVVIARKIVERLEDGIGDYFNEFKVLFQNSTENERNGFSTLAHEIEDLLIDKNANVDKKYLEIIKQICAQADASQISFPEFSFGLNEVIEKFGILVTDYHLEAIQELVKTKDKAEYEKKQTYFKKGFRVYAWLNQKFCSSCTKRADEDAEEVYNQAKNALSNGSYDEAIGLFQQVISMDSAYAYQNGCNFWIGECYERKGDFQTALDYYKKSVVTDATDPYKRSAYSSGLDVYQYDLPQSEENDLNSIAYIDEILQLTNDEHISKRAKFDKGWIYEWMHSHPMTDEKKEEYTHLAINWYEDYLETYSAGDYPEPYLVRDYMLRAYDKFLDFRGLPAEKRYQYQLQSIAKKLEYEKDFAAEQPSRACQALYEAATLNKRLGGDWEFGLSVDQKIGYYNDSIKQFGDVRAKYPEEEHNCQYALGYTIDCYTQLGHSVYSSIYVESGKKIYKQEHLFKAEQLYQQYFYEYPDQERYNLESLGYLQQTIAESYVQLNNLTNCISYYMKSNGNLERVIADTELYSLARLRAQYGIADNYWKISQAYRDLGKDPSNQNKYALQSISEWEKVIAFPDNDYDFYIAESKYNIAEIYREIGDFDNAITGFERVISEHSSGTDYQSKHFVASSWIGLGKCYYSKGEYEVAKEKFETVFTLQLDSPEGYHVLANLGIAKCEIKLGNYQHAHELLAPIVENHHQGEWYWDTYVLEAKDNIKLELLRIKIDPMVSELEPGESANFTASIVYPDDSPAPVPESAIIEWTWEVSGNEGDGHKFTSSGNSATYTGGSGDFMDTIITTKCHLNAGGYGRNKAVEPDIWIEGDNQVPICLVNEDGRRIKFAPMYVPWDGTDCGPPPAAETPVPMTLQFNTHYTIENPDQILLSFWGPAHTNETRIIYKETDIDSRLFVSDDHESTLEVEVPAPVTEGDIIAKRFNKGIPGEDKMKFNLYYSGEVISLEVPIWNGPGYGSEEIRTDLYAASNQVFHASKCEDLNPDDYITKNTKIQVLVRDPGARETVKKIRIITSVQEKEIEIIKVKPGVFKSKSIIPVNTEFEGETISIQGKERNIIRINPDSGLGKKEFKAVYMDTNDKITETAIPGKKPALVISALQPVVKPNLEPDSAISDFFKIVKAGYEIFTNNVSLLSVIDTVDIMNEYYNVQANYSPTRSDFDAFSASRYNLEEYEVIYITSHTEQDEGRIINIFKDEKEWESNSKPEGILVAATLGNLYPSGEKENKLVILNACNTGTTNNTTLWSSNIKARCLAVWNGKPSIYASVEKFESFFGFIGIKWKKQQKTTIKDAWKFGLSPFPIGADINFLGDTTETNLLP